MRRHFVPMLYAQWGHTVGTKPWNEWMLPGCGDRRSPFLLPACWVEDKQVSCYERAGGVKCSDPVIHLQESILKKGSATRLRISKCVRINPLHAGRHQGTTSGWQLEECLEDIRRDGQDRAWSPTEPGTTPNQLKEDGSWRMSFPAEGESRGRRWRRSV